jgi:hypothetical protein
LKSPEQMIGFPDENLKVILIFVQLSLFIKIINEPLVTGKRSSRLGARAKWLELRS